MSALHPPGGRSKGTTAHCHTVATRGHNFRLLFFRGSLELSHDIHSTHLAHLERSAFHRASEPLNMVCRHEIRSISSTRSHQLAPGGLACQRHCAGRRIGCGAVSNRPPCEPMQYAHHLKSTEDFAVLNHTLHRWTGRFWKALSFEEAQREALLWLDSHSGGAVIGARQARDAVNTALLWLPQLSDTQDSTLLIPLKNGYLVHEDRKFVLLPHDRALGVHYMINCDYLPSASPPALFSAFIERILPDTG